MANSKLIAAAGEHYVAYALSCFGYIPALVREGSPTIDLLAANEDGNKTISIQVKTTEWAERTRGRGDNKLRYELQFPLGHKAVENARAIRRDAQRASDDAPTIDPLSRLFFCFVDLRHLDPHEAPDVYVIPGKVLVDHYEGVDIREHSYFRLHWHVDQMDKFKNVWDPIHAILR